MSFPSLNFTDNFIKTMTMTYDTDVILKYLKNKKYLKKIKYFIFRLFNGEVLAVSEEQSKHNYNEVSPVYTKLPFPTFPTSFRFD